MYGAMYAISFWLCTLVVVANRVTSLKLAAVVIKRLSHVGSFQVNLLMFPCCID